MRRGSSGISIPKSARYLSEKGYPALLEFSMVGNARDNVANMSGVIKVEDELVLVNLSGKTFVVIGADYNIKKYIMMSNNTANESGRGCYSNNKLYICSGAYVQIYDVEIDDDGIVDITYNSSFGGSGTEDGKFTLYGDMGVASITTDGTYLYATDWGGHRLQKFTMAGQYVAKIGSLGAGNDQFNRPSGVSCFNGKLYVTEATGQRITVRNATDLSYDSKFDTVGTGDGEIQRVYDIYVDASGIYIGESTNKRGQKFNLSWEYVAKYVISSAVKSICVFGDRVVLTSSAALDYSVYYLNNTSWDLISTPFESGISSFIPAMPRITYDTTYTGQLVSSDGSINMPLPSDSVPGRDLPFIDIPATETKHFMLYGVPKDAIRVVSSMSMKCESPWPKFQEGPVCASGNYPYIWYDGSIYHCYYAYDSWTKFGHATSADGVTFTEDTEHNPVMEKSSSGTWDQTTIALPNVWIEGETWYMIYRGNGRNACLATSVDGLAWTKSGSNPVIVDCADPAGIMKVGSTYWLYSNVTNDNRYVKVYTSTDLVAWTLQTPNPLIAGYRYCACPFKFGAKYYLFVSTDWGINVGSGIELLESDDPTFLNAVDLGFVVLHNDKDGCDTPTIPTDSIYRDSFPDNKMRLYYAHEATGTYTRPLFLAIQDDIAAGIASAVKPFDPDTGILQ